MTKISDELLLEERLNAAEQETPDVGLDPLNCAKPIRVLYVDHTAMLGGGEIALLNLVRHLDRTKVTPIVALFSDGPLAEKLKHVCEVSIVPLSPNIRTIKKDSLGFATLLALRDILGTLSFTVRLASFIRDARVDLVHTNSLKSDIIGGIAGRLAKRPVIWHIRDRIENDYLPPLIVTVFRRLSTLIPQFVIANSHATLATLDLPSQRPSTYIFSGIEMPQKRAVVHDGLDATQNGGTLLPPRTSIIGLIGRICEWKGQHIFLDAAALVRKRFPEAKFRIVGAALFGEQDYETCIHKQCVDLGLEDVVEFMGFRSDISAIVESLDIVVHASITGEPFGQVIIEGMAAGKPVVATNGGGVPEIVVHNETGLLVPMGKATEMADAICMLLSNPARAQQMGVLGLERVRKHFTIQRAARQVESVYQNLLKPKGKRAPQVSATS